MELRELRTFCAVVETGGWSKASKIVHLTQPTISLQIQSLEANLGTCLFNRSTRERTLTESGKTCYEYAKRILALCDEAVQSVCDVNNLTKGTLRIGASTTVGEYILPSYLSSFKGIYSCVKISLEIGNSLEIIEDVVKGALEIGIVGTKINRPELIFKDFINNELVLIVPSNHTWAIKGEISLDQLKEEPFLIRTEGSGIRITLEKELEKAGLKEKDINVIMSLGNNEAIKKGVSSGLGISIVPRISIENEIKLDILKEVKIKNIYLIMNFYIVYNPNRFRSKIPEAFLDHLIE